MDFKNAPTPDMLEWDNKLNGILDWLVPCDFCGTTSIPVMILTGGNLVSEEDTVGICANCMRKAIKILEDDND